MLPSRRFTSQKLLILIIFALEFQIEEEHIKYYRFFEQDLELCISCFHNQYPNCTEFFKKILPSKNLDLRLLFKMFLPSPERRQVDLVRLRGTTSQFIAKYLAKDKQLLRELSREDLNSSALAQLFQDETRIDGVQFCNVKYLPRFMELFKPQNNELTIWLYLLLNIQPLLMPYLSENNFPVPQHYTACGFSIFQHYAGEPLVNFFESNDFELKLRIAKQLLEGALQLTQGFEGFRIYMTDLNADNIVYSIAEDRLSFVDLDSVLIADSRKLAQQQNATHKHEYIECMDCFAYSPQDICDGSMSDINIFAACQFLREDLKKDKRRGFLQPIPEKFRQLAFLLDECVDCIDSQCQSRFSAVRDLIEFIGRALSS